MNIIITMAGESSRFKAVGFSTPKFMLRANGQSLFAWSMQSLSNFFESRFIFIARQEHAARDFITAECAQLGIDNFEVVEIDGLTGGQAETALYAKPYIKSDEAIGIYNIDTYISEPLTIPETFQGQGWIPVFEAEGDKWSFVCFDEAGVATDIAEKKRISSFATVGFYYFKSFDIFARCLERYGFEDYQEKYIAPLYSVLIEDSHSQVMIEKLKPATVVGLGTPEDVLLFDENFSD
ncbi:MAG: glycosyltransferase family 2 protein [Bdellovibrionales bacterium]|nr:glycosyltransferase family 2 protein [Bdellovibrionales bacterium]